MMESARSSNLLVRGEVWGREVPVLLDSGGAVNLIGRKLIGSWPSDAQVCPPNDLLVRGANGQQVTLTGSIVVPVTFGGSKTVLTCEIAPQFAGGLLVSKPALHSLGAMMDLSTATASVYFKNLGVTLQEVGGVRESVMLGLSASQECLQWLSEALNSGVFRLLW